MHPSIYFLIAGVIALTGKTSKAEKVTKKVVLPVTKSRATSVKESSNDSGTGFAVAAVLSGNPVAAVAGGVIGGYTGGIVASAIFDDGPSWDWDD